MLVTATPELTSAWAAGGGSSTRPTTGPSASRCSTPPATPATDGSSPSCSTRASSRGPGATDVYLMGADDPTHAVDVTDSLAAGVASLRAHRAYLDGLGRDFDPEQFLRAVTAGAGERSAFRTPSPSAESNSRASNSRSAHSSPAISSSEACTDPITCVLRTLHPHGDGPRSLRSRPR